MKLPRWLHRLYAWARGYFWIPCPKCGRMFGGHEAREGHTTYAGKTTCPDCPRPLVRLAIVDTTQPGAIIRSRGAILELVEGDASDVSAWLDVLATSRWVRESAERGTAAWGAIEA